MSLKISSSYVMYNFNCWYFNSQGHMQIFSKIPGFDDGLRVSDGHPRRGLRRHVSQSLWALTAYVGLATDFLWAKTAVHLLQK